MVFNAGTGNLKKNWPQKGTSTDWAMVPARDEDLPDHHADGWAVQQLEAEHDRPFFLMVGILRPHVPWYVPKKWFDLYDQQELTLPPYDQTDLNEWTNLARKPETEALRRELAGQLVEMGLIPPATPTNPE